MKPDTPAISDRTLTYLVALATHGGMRQAAQSLGINVSTISRQLAAVEREFKLSLLTRHGRNSVLTEIGSAFVEYSNEKEKLEQKLNAQLDEYRFMRRGHVTLGAGAGIMTHLITGSLKRFSIKYPEIRVEIRSGPQSKLVQLVRDDIVDICIYNGASLDPILNSRLFRSEPLCVVVSVLHKLAGRATVRIEDIVTERLIFLPNNFAAQIYVDAILRDMGIDMSPAYRVDRFEAALSLAAENLGIAFSSPGGAADKTATGQLVAIPIDHPIAQRFDHYVATRLGRKLIPAANYLWRDIIRTMSSL
ncbi:LysR family transcriptional regulator [Paraburkholderia fungorum]|uniref:LysR family transcriptional regulator n=1 Tax=Paraburkholderia fungorum TaxID=134537 RepID=A0A420FF74_9BURK|nr:LysR family transcriptional regulator [Paraburkholderia fungorum]RKF31491.1 LysR family transcriptional regulator [Paraburkholderia fungorum]